MFIYFGSRTVREHEPQNKIKYRKRQKNNPKTTARLRTNNENYIGATKSIEQAYIPEILPTSKLKVLPKDEFNRLRPEKPIIHTNIHKALNNLKPRNFLKNFPSLQDSIKNNKDNKKSSKVFPKPTNQFEETISKKLKSNLNTSTKKVYFNF